MPAVHPTAALFHAPTAGPHPDVLSTSLKHVAQLAMQTSPQQFAIAVHTKGQLKASVIAQVLGQPLVKELLKRNVAHLGDLTIYLLTERIQDASFRGPVLAPHVALAFHARVLALPGVTAVAYVPWTPAELAEYLAAHVSTPIPST